MESYCVPLSVVLKSKTIYKICDIAPVYSTLLPKEAS